MDQNSENDFSELPEEEGESSEVLALLRKIQQQLVYLEKKVDALVNQSGERPFQEKRFSRPHRSFGRPSHRYGEGNRESHPRGEGNFAPRRRFDRPQSDGNRSYGPRKGPFTHRRRDRD